MKHIDLYIADDGTKFNNREECARYEFNCMATARQFANRIKFFDKDKQPLDVCNPDTFEDVWCIVPMDESIMEEYNDAYYNSDMDDYADYLPEPITRPDCYYSPDCILVYHIEWDKWENLIEKLEQLQSEIDYWKNERA